MDLSEMALDMDLRKTAMDILGLVPGSSRFNIGFNDVNNPKPVFFGPNRQIFFGLGEKRAYVGLRPIRDGCMIIEYCVGGQAFRRCVLPYLRKRAQQIYDELSLIPSSINWEGILLALAELVYVGWWPVLEIIQSAVPAVIKTELTHSGFVVIINEGTEKETSIGLDKIRQGFFFTIKTPEREERTFLIGASHETAWDLYEAVVDHLLAA